MVGSGLWTRLMRAAPVACVTACVQSCGSDPPDTAARFEYSALPEVRVVERAVLGGLEAEGPGALGDVRSIALLTEPRAIAVSDGHTQTIHVFSLDGELLGSAGGRGGGPGEFKAIGQMRASQDGRLHVWDIQQSRVTILESDLTFVDSYRAVLDPIGAIFPDFVGFLADGSFILRDVRSGIGMGNVPEGILQDTVRLYHYSATGEFTDTLAVLLDEPKWFRNRDGMWGRQDLIFGRQLTALAVQDEVWTGSTEVLSFTRHGLDGETLGELDFGTIPRPASPQDIEAERRRRLDEVQVQKGPTVIGDGRDLRVVAAEAERDGIQEMRGYETIPAYDLAVAGQDGLLLLRQYPRPDEAMAWWMLIKKGGSLIGRLRLPRTTQIMAASAELLVLLERDTYDAPVVRVMEWRVGDVDAS